MNILFNKLVIFYANGQVHHARVDLKRVYDGNRETNYSEYIYPNELNNEIGKIMSIFHVNDYGSLEALGVIQYVDYTSLNEKEKKQEEIYKKNRRRQDFENSRLAEIIDSADDLVNRVVNKLKKLNINIKKLVIYALVSSMLLVGGTFAVKSFLERDKIEKEHAIVTIEQVFNDEKVSKHDLDILIKLLSKKEEMTFAELYENKEMRELVFNSFKTDGYFFETALSRFKKFGGLKNIRDLSGSELEHFCIYVTNLVMGGDNYSSLYGATGHIAASLDTTTGQKHEDILNSFSKKYNISKDRVEYSALPSESMAYDQLPAIMQYIILCQAEEAVKQANFEFKYIDKPSWWASLHSTYNYEKLLEEIVNKKNACIDRIYEIYSNSRKK